MGKLPGIQLARAIAALSVCYFHSWTVLDRFPKGTAYPIPWLAEYGWVGVDVFFAISGFVIAMQLSKTGFRPTDFLFKRVLRLYPLWWLTLTMFAALALAWRGLSDTETLRYFLYSASLLPTEQFPFYDIGWSLQHEMMFYLVAAIIAPLVGIFGLVGFLVIGSILVHNLPITLHNLAFYYPEFIAGILAFLLLPRVKRFGPASLLAVGAASLYLFLTQWGGRNFFPISLFFLVSGFASMQRAPLVGLGDASYSIYLLHPIVFSVLKAASIPVAGLLWLEEPIRWTAIGVVLILSLLCFKYFESPMNGRANLMEIRRKLAPS